MMSSLVHVLYVIPMFYWQSYVQLSAGSALKQTHGVLQKFFCLFLTGNFHD